MTSPPRIPHRLAAGPAAVALALVMACAAPAHADSLSSGRVVTPAGADVCDFHLATSPVGGRVALLYTTAEQGCGGSDVQLAARLGLGRNLGPVRALENPKLHARGTELGIFSADVAVSPDGSAVAAWVARGRERDYDQLRVAVAPPGRGFRPARTLARRRTRKGHVPEIAVAGVVAGSHGRAVVGWTAGPNGGTSLRAAVRARGGRFGAPQTLSRTGRSPHEATQASLAISPAGSVVVAWSTAPARPATAAAAVLRAGHRRFGATRLISSGGGVDTVRAFAGPGGAAVTWSENRRIAGVPLRLRLARLRGSGTLAAAQTVVELDPGPQALEIDGLQAAFPRRGPAAAWQVFRDISEAGDGRKDMTSIVAASPAAGSPTAARRLSDPAALTGLPTIGALTDRTLLAWPEHIGGAWHLRLAVKPADGPWQPTRTLADINGTIVIAASARSALVLWQPFEPRAEDRRLRLAVYRP